MRVLFVTPNLPYPPQQGAALRNFGILYSLAQKGAAITLLTFCDNPPPQVPSALSALCSVECVPVPPRTLTNRLRDLAFSNLPDLAMRLHSDAFRSRLMDILRSGHFDLIQFEGLEVAAYAPTIKQMGTSPFLIYDAHNAEFALQQIIAQIESERLSRLPATLYSRIQARRIFRFERYICDNVNGVLAVSEADADHLRHLGSKTPIFTLPNGIFVDEYASSGTSLDLAGTPLVFTGKMDYRPNVDAMLWFAESIFPAITAEHPQAHLYVVGQSVHAKLLPLQENSPNISFTRWVESVKPFLHHARVFVAPLRMGSGTRLKILEAMAAGCAIVATSTAISGLMEAAHEAVVVADTADEFARAVNRLLADDDECARLGAVAKTFVQSCYDWSVLAPQLMSIYAELGIG